LASDLASLWLSEYEAERLAEHQSWLDYALALTKNVELKPDRISASTAPSQWWCQPKPNVWHRDFKPPTGITLRADDHYLVFEVLHEAGFTLRFREPILLDGSNIPARDTAEQVLADSLTRLRAYTKRATCHLTPDAQKELLHEPMARAKHRMAAMLRAQEAGATSWLLRIPS